MTISDAGKDVGYHDLEGGAISDADDALEGFTKSSTGLQFRILREGDGTKPVATDTVLAHYKGQTTDGNQFDSSYDRGQPIPFPLNGVISGWTEGLQEIGEGGMIELVIPYALGYGERGNPPVIPAKATLQFIVELQKVN